MSVCEFYKVEKKVLHSREIGRSQGPPTISKIPWCAHEGSPVQLRHATNTLRGSNVLKCQGDVTQCQKTPPISGE